ncbi:T9SS type B sorting domain-containing protein [Hymenobacter sp. HD11105]
MKNIYRLLVLLPALLLATLAPAQTCPPPPPGVDFVARDASGSEVTTFCVGREVRFFDTSAEKFTPVLYAKSENCPIPTNANFESTASYIPTEEDGRRGFVIVSQNSVQPGGGRGFLVSKRFDVKRTDAPTFTISVCSDELVEVNITDQIYAANLYTVKVGDAETKNVERGQPRFYAIPTGATTVTVTGSHAGNNSCTNSDTKSFTPIARPRRPSIRQLTVRNSNIEFDVTDLQANFRYEIQVAEIGAPGGYRTVNTFGGNDAINGSILHTVTNSPLPGCYRVRPASTCPASSGANFPASMEVCTVDLGTVSVVSTSSNGQNHLIWTTFDPIVSTFVVRRDERIIATLPGSDREYIDTTASCGTTYAYKVTALINRTASESNTSSVLTAAGRPPLPPRLVATFTLSNEVELYATNAVGQPLPNELTFLRTSPNPADVGVVNAPIIRDAPTDLNVSTPPTYVARRRDACGSLSADSDPAAPVVLAADPQPDGARFTWSALVGPDPSIPVRYQIIRIALNGATIDTQPTTGLSFVDSEPPSNQSTVRYRIEATGGGLVTASYSNLVNVTQTPRLAMPTAFSPNGDGLNDVLQVRGKFIGTFTFTIIDRNGQEVFRSTDRSQSWDGRINGREPVPGAYAWRFESITDEGKPFVQHGAITIVR